MENTTKSLKDIAKEYPDNHELQKIMDILLDRKILDDIFDFLKGDYIMEENTQETLLVNEKELKVLTEIGLIMMSPTPMFNIVNCIASNTDEDLAKKILNVMRNRNKVCECP